MDRWQREIVNRCASIRKTRDMVHPRVMTNRSPSIMVELDCIAESSVVIVSPPQEISAAAATVVVVVQDAFRFQWSHQPHISTLRLDRMKERVLLACQAMTRMMQTTFTQITTSLTRLAES